LGEGAVRLSYLTTGAAILAGPKALLRQPASHIFHVMGNDARRSTVCVSITGGAVIIVGSVRGDMERARGCSMLLLVALSN